MLEILKRYWSVLVLVIFLVAWSLLLSFFGPQELVGRIGIENTYLVAFLMAVFGGLSSLTGASFLTVIATFAEGGSNPALLGLAGGTGLFISDSVFYWVARHSIDKLEHKLTRLTGWLRDRIQRLPLWAVLLGAWAYMSLTPLPGDLLMIALALAGIRYRYLAPVIFAAGVTVVVLVSYIGMEVFSWL